MENNNNTVCPVCSLFLREGITLQAHLNTHPKEQVIEALLKISNGGPLAPASQAVSTSTGSSYVPVQTFANSHSSFISTPYVNPQTQMTTAVTYQHFMTSNGSTVMPQFIQVPTIVNPNSNIPVISNQSMNFIPNQTYPETVYNPLYNPYIPQPYPFTQPLYTSVPVSALPSGDTNIQSNEGSNNSDVNTQGGSTTQPSVLVKKCNVATSTELRKKCSKSGSKKSVLRRLVTCRKRRLFRSKLSEPSSSLSVIKSPVKSGLSSLGRVSALSKRSVIRTIRPKIILGTSNGNSNLRTITPPPLTLITGTASNSISNSKTPPPPPPPLAKAPCITPQPLSFIKSEKVLENGVSQSTPEIIIDSTNSSEVKFFEQPQKLGSVIVESNALIQNNASDLRNNQEITKTSEIEVPTVETVVESIVINSDIKIVKDVLGIEKSEDVNDRLDAESAEEYNESVEEEDIDEEDEENLEEQEKVVDKIEIEENKIDVNEVDLNQSLPEEISENNEKNYSDSDIFSQQENILYNENLNKESESDIAPYPEFVEVASIDAENINCEKSNENQTSHDFNYIDKQFNETQHENGKAECEGMIEGYLTKHAEVQPITYTDLQPARSSRVYSDLGLTPAINLNSYMEVDGIKIFFNNTTTVPFDPLMKLTKVQSHSRDLTGFLKTENSASSQTIVDSVIQLVSGNNESKNGFVFNETYPATTSQNIENQLDLPDLSPLALNIQADESMPARGELSEQESLGAENSTWNLFHSDNANNAKSPEEWRNSDSVNSTKSLEEWENSDNALLVSVVENKKSGKTFKCSLCSEVFSCPKERRVHKNTVHLNKTEKDVHLTKKPKSYACSFCSEVFKCLRDRKIHVIQSHFAESKTKKSTDEIKEENADLEPENAEKSEAAIKSEEDPRNNVKTENSLPCAELECQRVKYCSQCSLPFAGVKKLREHLRLVHGEIRFKCENCSQTFDEESEYNDHLLIHPLVCEKCGKTFHKKANLNLHMKRHLEVKPYECSLCPKSFITRQKLEEHMNGHSGKKPLKCTLCDKTFSRHSNLIQHRNLHHLNIKKKIKDFVCRCGEVFHSLRKLEWHKEVHEAKPKPCPFCSQKFIHSASVTRHIRRAHLPEYLPGGNREFDNVQCPVCEKIYLRSSLVVHMRVHNGEKPFACKICNKCFSTKWNLELHNWTHQSRSNMPFKCNFCKGAFFREPDFIAHLNAHRNYKPFTCNVCGQKFIRKYSCLRHQEEHKKSKQFVCAVSGCAKSFHRSYYLRDHMKVHTGVRPHTCHICGKASSTKSNHNKHVRIHDTREPVNTEN